MSLIVINPERCTNCMNCARACPVQAISVVLDLDRPEFIRQRCIGCGSCVKACRDGAITFQNNTWDVKSYLDSGSKVAAIVDPSISAEFPDITDYRKFVEMIRALGFDFVYDASFGVELVAGAYQKLFKAFKGKYFITANCPAIVHFIQKYQPGLIQNLAPIVSPMIASSRAVHSLPGNEMKVVFIGPCIAAKLDLENKDGDSKIDAVITFSELRQLFTECGVHESQLEYSEFDPPSGKVGSLYPISNGILQVAEIDEGQLSGTVITEDGNRRSLKAIHSFENSIDQVQKHFNLFYDEGCIMGPGMSDVGDKLSRSARVVAYTQKRFRDVDREHWQKEIDEFSTIDLHRTFKNDDQRLPTPDNDRINEILRLIGKSETKHNRSCGQCGFDSCRHFATSVAQGLTRTEMCIDFSINNKNKYITTLRENRKEARQTLKELGGELDDTRKEYDLLKEKLETSRKIMNQIPSGVVITDEKLKVLSSNTSFIDLLGDEARDINEVVPGLRGADLKTLVPIQFYKVFQNVLATGENILSRDVMIDGSLLNLSVFSIRGHKVVGGIVRDMHTPEVRNEQIIQRVTEVIDQNLNMVQQIGFLLGEGASKTEAMLNSIIRLHEKKKKG